MCIGIMYYRFTSEQIAHNALVKYASIVLTQMTKEEECTAVFDNAINSSLVPIFNNINEEQPHIIFDYLSRTCFKTYMI